MIKHRLIRALTRILVIVFVLSTASVALAQSSASEDVISWFTFTSLGGARNSTSYQLNETLGQLAPGLSSSANYVLNAGFQQDWRIVAPDAPARSFAYLALVRTLEPPFPSVGNGDFDSANDPVWMENSTWNQALIYSEDAVAEEADAQDFRAHSLPNVAWLGGKVNEQSTLWQRVMLPAGYSDVRLSFWHVIGSNEATCGDDLGYVEVDSATLAAFDLCRDTNTDGWQRVEVSLADYMGTAIDVTFRSTQDGEEVSNWFLDDVVLCDGTSARPCE